MTEILGRGGLVHVLSSCGAAPRGQRFSGIEEARDFLRRLANEPGGVDAIRRWARTGLDAGSTAYGSDQDMLDAIAPLLADGRLTIAEAGRFSTRGLVGARGAAGADGGGGAPPPEKAKPLQGNVVTRADPPPPPPPPEDPAPPPPAPAQAPAAPPPVAAEDDAHWIEIELIGEDEKPVPGMAYVVTLPDGAEIRGKLDGEGFARIADIAEAGTCAICFPDLDKDAWTPVESTGPKSGAAS